MSLLDAITSAIGEALAELTGHVETRTTATARALEQVSRGSGTLASVDGVNLTLSAGAFGAGVVAGTRLRLLSGASAGATATISSVGGGGTTAVVGAGLPASFSGLSWEVERLADTSIPVESTLAWPSAGDFYARGIRHRFTGRTATTLTGITHYDGADWLPGVGVELAPATIVADYTRARSALDLLRRSFFVETARNAELTDLATNLGRDRPPMLTDAEQFRAWLRAVAFAPHGTRLALFQLLDALFGAGAWETLEDFTGSGDFARIYVRLTNEDPTDPEGRWYLDQPARVLPASTTSIVLPETPIRVESVTLARDTSERLVATGTASTTNGIALTGAAGTFPARVRRGDLLRVLDGPLAGEVGRVLTYTSATSITLGPVRGLAHGPLSGSAASFRFEVVREVTDCRSARPSTDVAIEYDGDTGTTAWAWGGTGVETTHSLIVTDALAGDRTAWGSFTAGVTGYYERAVRVNAESNAEITLIAAPATSTILSPTNGLQWAVDLQDGERMVRFGFLYVDGVLDRVAFLDSGGAELVGATIGASTQYRTFRLRKRGRGLVELEVDGAVVLRSNYNDLSTTSARFLRMGCLTTAAASIVNVRVIAWAIETPTDYLATRTSGGTTTSGSSNIGGLAGLILVGDVGRALHVDGGDARNPGGGTSNGTWEITARIDANTATVRGRDRAGATFRRGHPSRIFLPADAALMFPDALGHTFRVLDGPHAGTYPIARLLDGGFADIAVSLPASTGANAAIVGAGVFSPTVRVQSTIVEVTGAPAGGFTATDGEYGWRIEPVFPTDASLAVQLEDAASVSGATITLRQALPAAQPVDVTFSRVLSGHVEAEGAINDATTPRWPAYLWDAWGQFRGLVLDAAAAGFVIDLNSLQRDASGLHIVDEGTP